ncbi:MAG: hypothetical protein LBT58_04480, partial [Endomicrobium sp.]|nr:hypothetical protein [Endomicrobium sp.]
MKRKIALCLIVCLSLSLSPFSSAATAATADWADDFIPLAGIVLFVSFVYWNVNIQEARKNFSRRWDEIKKAREDFLQREERQRCIKLEKKRRRR